MHKNTGGRDYKQCILLHSLILLGLRSPLQEEVHENKSIISTLFDNQIRHVQHTIFKCLDSQQPRNTGFTKPVVVSYRDANKRLKQEEQSSLLRKREASALSAAATTYEKDSIKRLLPHSQHTTIPIFIHICLLVCCLLFFGLVGASTLLVAASACGAISKLQPPIHTSSAPHDSLLWH